MIVSRNFAAVGLTPDVQSRHLVDRVEDEPFRLGRSDPADVSEGREAAECLEPLGEVVGCHEVGEAGAQPAFAPKFFGPSPGPRRSSGARWRLRSSRAKLSRSMSIWASPRQAPSLPNCRETWRSPREWRSAWGRSQARCICSTRPKRWSPELGPGWRLRWNAPAGSTWLWRERQHGNGVAGSGGKTMGSGI